MTTLISFLLLSSYVGLICWKYGIPDTISESYYLTKGKPWFSLVIIGSALLLIPEAHDLFALLGIGFLLLTGIFPKFKERGYQNILHFLGARMAGIISQLYIVWLGYPWILVSWIFLPILMKKKGHPYFWLEVVCLINLYIGLLWVGRG